MPLSQYKIEIANQRIRELLRPTPVMRSRYYSEKLGADVWFKLEMMQPTHSFKVRGATNAVMALPQPQREKGVITASGGNHGMGVALIAKKLGIPAWIYLPTITPEPKIEAIRNLGASIVVEGEAFDEASMIAQKRAEEDGLTYVPPFDHDDVIAGQGTLVCELVEQIQDIDVIVASIGGGGLISGILSAREYLIPRTKVFGVEPLGADCMRQSIESGEIVALSKLKSIAESLGAKKPTQRTFDIVREHIDGLFTTTDEASVRSLVEVLEHEKLLIEPAASCCLAALESGEIPYQQRDRIVVVICGANVSMRRVTEWRERWGI